MMTSILSLLSMSLLLNAIVTIFHNFNFFIVLLLLLCFCCWALGSNRGKGQFQKICKQPRNERTNERTIRLLLTCYHNHLFPLLPFLFLSTPIMLYSNGFFFILLLFVLFIFYLSFLILLFFFLIFFLFLFAFPAPKPSIQAITLFTFPLSPSSPRPTPLPKLGPHFSFFSKLIFECGFQLRDSVSVALRVVVSTAVDSQLSFILSILLSFKRMKY